MVPLCRLKFDDVTATLFSIVLSLILFYKLILITEGKTQALVGAIPFCGEHPGPRLEDKFRLSNQMDGFLIADGGKMADS